MGISKEWGKELQSQHFQRETFPFQGYCLYFTIPENDENGEMRFIPQKTQTFYIAEAKTKDNQLYTLSCMETVLRDHCTDPAFEETFRRAETIYFIGDGSEKQNWNKNVFLGIEQMIRDFQNPDGESQHSLLPNVKNIEILKTVQGHGKDSLKYSHQSIFPC